MSASIYLIVRFRARAGQEDALKQALGTLVAPTRREAGCVQYDFL
jgi:quinol monooxygenase YgiN